VTIRTFRRRAYRLVAALWLAVLAGCASVGPSPADTPSAYAVTGIVRVSPACPGPVRLDSPCPDRPLGGATVTASRNARTIASTITDASGHYRLDLPPGRYDIVAINVGGYASRATRTIDVPPSAVVDLTVDSGMR
jgi:hypothetical protein